MSAEVQQYMMYVDMIVDENVVIFEQPEYVVEYSLGEDQYYVEGEEDNYYEEGWQLSEGQKATEQSFKKEEKVKRGGWHRVDIMRFNLKNLSYKNKVLKCKELLRFTNRGNVDELIRKLEDLGYFTAPGSLDKHHLKRGGLLEHSLETFQRAMKMRQKCERGKDGWTKENVKKYLPVRSIIVLTLLHDIWKADELCFDTKYNCVLSKQGEYNGDLVEMIQSCGFQLNAIEKECLIYNKLMKEGQGADVNSLRHDNYLYYYLYKADEEDLC